MALLKSSPHFASALLALVALSGAAFAQIPPGAATSNVRVVGYSEVDGRPRDGEVIEDMSVRRATRRFFRRLRDG